MYKKYNIPRPWLIGSYDEIDAANFVFDAFESGRSDSTQKITKFSPKKIHQSRSYCSDHQKGNWKAGREKFTSYTIFDIFFMMLVVIKVGYL